MIWFKSTMSLFFAQLFALVRSQGSSDEICVEGFVMDKFCVDLGKLLDKPDLLSLEFPGEHSLHCLVDVKSCYESPYLILGEPVAGSTMYTVEYQVDDSGKELLIGLARGIGLSGNYPACSTCVNDADDGLLAGFRAEIFGVVTNGSTNPPILTVTKASVSNGLTASEICALQQTPTTTPIAAPQAMAPVAVPIPTAAPTRRPITAMPITELPITTIPPTITPVLDATASPTLTPIEQETSTPSADPTMKPVVSRLSEQPSEVEISAPSATPAVRTAATVPTATPTSSPNNTTSPTNTDPTDGNLTNTGAQNNIANSTSTAATIQMDILSSHSWNALNEIFLPLLCSIFLI